jgi:hypothetical protein
MLEEGAMYRRIGIIVAAAAMGMLVAGTSAQAANTPVLAWSQGGTTITSSYDYGTLDAGAGATKSVTFTLTNSGDSASAMLTVSLSGSAAFSINVDGCTGTSLGPNKSCGVTVTFAPTASGESDNATLTAQGKKAAANASITLTGKSGTPDLTLTPGALGQGPPQFPGTGTDPNGTKSYNYDFGSGSSATKTFTVQNIGNGTSNALQLACCNAGFALSNDNTSGVMLPPGGTRTFDLTFTAPAGCSTKLFATPLLVTSSTASPYIRVTYSASCGPAITSATATLGNLTYPYEGNPQFVSIGSGNLAGISVYGTLKNVSFSLRLHGFTIQIPFSINAGTLNCDMSRSYAPGTCSVSNNVLTVTQNFPVGFTSWIPGHFQQINYVYVGSSLPPGEVCCAYVTWGAPVVTAVH